MNFSDFPLPLLLDTEEFSVDLVQMAVRQHIPNMAMSRLTLNQQRDMATNGMVLTLAAKLAGKDTAETHTSPPRVTATVSVPLTWWDHCKQVLRDSMPALCGRLRVTERLIETTLTQAVTTRTTRLCPHIGVESQYAHLRFLAAKPLYFSPEDLVQMDDNRHRREWEAKNGRGYPIKPAEYTPWTSPHNF